MANRNQNITITSTCVTNTPVCCNIILKKMSQQVESALSSSKFRGALFASETIESWIVSKESISLNGRTENGFLSTFATKGFGKLYKQREEEEIG